VKADVDKSLLFEESLLKVTLHLLGSRLDAEASDWSNEFGACRHLTSLFKLSQILVLLWPVLGV